MVQTTKLAAQPRQRAGKGAARATRRSGLVPGVLYGEKAPPALIALDPKALAQELAKPGFFTRVFDIEVDGKAQRALARDVQLHPVNDRAEHVDFMRVGETTRIRVAVPVYFANQDKSPGLKRGGVLNVVRHAIDVYCSIGTIPSRIEVDLEGLDIGDSVHISAIKLPEGVKPTITTRDFTVASVAAPSVLKSPEEEAAEAAAKVAAATAEGAVPAEGAAAAPAGGAGDKKPAAGAAAAAPAGGDKKGGKK